MSPTGGTHLATLLLAGDLHHRACWLGAGNEVFVKLIKTTEARRKGKLISHGNQLDLIQKNKQRVRSVSLAGCFSGKGITRRFPPKGMALCCCSLCNWGFRSGTKSHYHKISLSEKKVDIYEAQEGVAKQDESIGVHMGRGLPCAMGPGAGRAAGGCWCRGGGDGRAMAAAAQAGTCGGMGKWGEFARAPEGNHSVKTGG